MRSQGYRSRIVAVPNIAAASDAAAVQAIATAASDTVALLDVHSDADHERSVLTLAGDPSALRRAAIDVVEVATARIDMTRYAGVHPSVGAVDVWPVVDAAEPNDDIVLLAHDIGTAIAETTGVPVYFYGAAARRSATRELRDIRRGGVAALAARVDDLPPDEGPRRIDPRVGAVCVGARGPLIAFNVNLDASQSIAGRVARELRAHPGIRALALPVGGAWQISMNLVDPARTGIEHAFDVVAAAARTWGVAVRSTELVGLVPERFLPAPESKAARLLIEPGRSLEAALART